MDSTLPRLILGTAMWGWTCPKERAFELLDIFYEAGYRGIDGATNYPINKNSADFRASENILKEWIQTHGVTDLEIIMKVGSINNLRTPEHNLSKSFLLLNLDYYQNLLAENLGTFMIHWDNRQEEEAIADTFEVFQIAKEAGLQPGLSGIKYPETYARLNTAYSFDFSIQCKHNLLQSDYLRYAAFHGKPRFISYGITAGGRKFPSQEYHKDSGLIARGGDISNTPALIEAAEQAAKAFTEKTGKPIQSFNHCGMIYAFHQPDMAGILIGPSQSEQLKDSLAFYQQLQTDDYAPFFQTLQALSKADE